MKSYYASIDHLMLLDQWALHIKGNSLFYVRFHGRILVLAPVEPVVRLTVRSRLRLFHFVFESHDGGTLVPISKRTEPVSNIDTMVVDRLTALDCKRPIREADSTPASPSSSCGGIHNRLHGLLHRLVVYRIDVGEFVRDRLQELRALARSQQRRGAAD